MATVLDLTGESALSKLINYNRYFLLDDDDEIALIVLCLALNPEELTGQWGKPLNQLHCPLSQTVP